jgi:hypothetical protein
LKSLYELAREHIVECRDVTEEFLDVEEGERIFEAVFDEFFARVMGLSKKTTTAIYRPGNMPKSPLGRAIVEVCLEKLKSA